MRLIDVDVFREDLKRERENLILNGLLGTPQDYKEIDRFIKRLDEQPTIEVEPVKHGKWIITPNGMGRNINTGEMSYSYKCDCNICGFHTGNQGLKFHYCPNCGARMDGDKDES